MLPRRGAEKGETMGLSEESEIESNVVDVDFGGGAAAQEGTTVAKDANLGERVIEEIRKEPRTVEQLAVACDATEKQIRNAVTALRRKYQSDSGDHIVSFKRSYWTAAELERRGHVLEPTSRGTLKVKKSTKTGGKKKEPKTPKTKKPKGPSKDEIASAVIEELGDSPGAQKVAGLVMAKYDAYQEAEAELPRVRQKTRDMKTAADAAFKEAIEDGHGGTEAEAVQKLHNCEQSWQHKLERYSEAVELRKEALHSRNAARDAFAGLMENVRQLDLFENVA